MDSKEIRVIDEMRLRLEQIASGICESYDKYIDFLNCNIETEKMSYEELRIIYKELYIRNRDSSLGLLNSLYGDNLWLSETTDLINNLLDCEGSFAKYSNALIWNLQSKSECEVNFKKRKKDFQDSFSEYRTNLNNRINRLVEKHEDYYELVKAFSNDEVVIEQIEWEVLQDE